MHRPTKERLEEILSAPGMRSPAEVERHLAGCEECRQQLGRFQEQSRRLRLLRPGEEVGPAAGFYARVMDRIESQQRASMWSVFLEPAFGRRLVMATLTLILALGSLLAFRETESAYYSAEPPEAVVAVEDHPPGLGTDTQRDRETILVTLASYRE